ncbi:hypothetical protein V8C44DRAFT_145674 [Trichoderma aethiopicum]
MSQMAWLFMLIHTADICFLHFPFSLLYNCSQCFLSLIGVLYSPSNPLIRFYLRFPFLMLFASSFSQRPSHLCTPPND